jgi:hypothetical protein
VRSKLSGSVIARTNEMVFEPNVTPAISARTHASAQTRTGRSTDAEREAPRGPRGGVVAAREPATDQASMLRS